MTIYLCDDTIDGIFTAIYKAWEDGCNHTDVRVYSESDTMSLFEEYVTVTSDNTLANKVAESIKKKLSHEIYYYVYHSALSSNRNKASYIYHFLQKAFKSGPLIINQLQDNTVMNLFSMTRFVNNELCRYRGFVRFEELTNGALVSVIDPVNNIVPLLAEHFSDRLHNETWIILDSKRNIAAIHSADFKCTANNSYILTTNITTEFLSALSNTSENEKQFKELWQGFYNTIAIKERTNYNLQRNMMPLRYRTYMPEV